MMNFKDNETTEEEAVAEEYDYMNEEPLEEEETFDYEEQEDTYCD